MSAERAEYNPLPIHVCQVFVPPMGTTHCLGYSVGQRKADIQYWLTSARLAIGQLQESIPKLETQSLNACTGNRMMASEPGFCSVHDSTIVHLSTTAFLTHTQNWSRR